VQLRYARRLIAMIAFPLRRMQSLITRKDLLWAITIESLYCNVLKVHFGYLLHPLADGTAQSCLCLCLEVCTSFLIMLKLIKLATTPKLGIPVESVRFLMKLLLKQRILDVYHDFH